MIKKFKDIEKDFDFLVEFGSPRGNDTGFESLDEIYSIKYGAYTIILAEPHSGKSELGFELCMGQAEQFGKKTLVYSPETGSVADIYAELIHKHTGKPISQKLPNALTMREIYSASAWVDAHFSIIDSDDRGYTYYDIMKMRTDESLIFVDPNNEVIHEYTDRQDTYIENVTADIRRFCKKNDCHMIITMHPAKQETSIDANTGKRYFDMPKARMAAGGQAWFRKAMGWINMWRPAQGLTDVDGMPYAENCVIVEVEKAKPKGIGRKGSCMLFWDFKRNRYFEEGLTSGGYLYSFDNKRGFSYKPADEFEKPTAMQANINFDNSDFENPYIIPKEIEGDDDLPF